MRAELRRLKRDTESGRASVADSGTAGAAPNVPSQIVNFSVIHFRLQTLQLRCRVRQATEVPVARADSWTVLVPVAVVIAAAMVGISYFRSHRRATRLTEVDAIVLSDFDNKTGDEVFDDTMKQGLLVQLEQSPFLDLVSERKVIETFEADGPLGQRPIDAGACARGVPAHGQQGHGDRLDCEARQSICRWPGSRELQLGTCWPSRRSRRLAKKQS